jgi:hypothetical protein
MPESENTTQANQTQATENLIDLTIGGETFKIPSKVKEHFTNATRSIRSEADSKINEMKSILEKTNMTIEEKEKMISDYEYSQKSEIEKVLHKANSEKSNIEKLLKQKSEEAENNFNLFKKHNIASDIRNSLSNFETSNNVQLYNQNQTISLFQLENQLIFDKNDKGEFETKAEIVVDGIKSIVPLEVAIKNFLSKKEYENQFRNSARSGSGTQKDFSNFSDRQNSDYKESELSDQVALKRYYNDLKAGKNPRIIQG